MNKSLVIANADDQILYEVHITTEDVDALVEQYESAGRKVFIVENNNIRLSDMVIVNGEIEESKAPPKTEE